MCRDTEGNGRGWEGKHFQRWAEKKIGRQKELRRAMGLVELSRRPGSCGTADCQETSCPSTKQPELVSEHSVVAIVHMCLLNMRVLF